MKQATQSSTNTIDHYEKPIQFADQQSKGNTSSVSLEYESGAITSETENGYDTVDYSYLRRHYENQQYTTSNKTDTTKEMESSPDTTINWAEKTNNPISPGVMYRSFKNKLRNSFRKSKKYLRNEQTRLANLFEDKQKSKTAANEQKIVPSSNLEDYKKIYSDQKAERLYQTINAKLQQPAGVDSTEDLSDQYMLDLIDQITNQRIIKRQLRNALEICRSRPEFECSTELIEAERLLLVSNLKEAAAKRQLMKIDNEDRDKRETTKNVGTITLNHCEFPLTDATVCDAIFNYYYVCVFTYKDQVKATLAKEKNGDRVYFRNCEIKFWEVEPNFEIKMEVYALRLRKPAHQFSHESKFHLEKVRLKWKRCIFHVFLNFYILIPGATKKLSIRLPVTTPTYNTKKAVQLTHKVREITCR
jgi:hypothetical protein